MRGPVSHQYSNRCNYSFVLYAVVQHCKITKTEVSKWDLCELCYRFMLVPFLFELRTVLDWLCSDTSLLVFEWLKMEHIFYTAFHVKCLRDTNEQFSSLRGPPKKPPLELFIACGILLLVIGAIWFPMILFSFSMYGNDLPSEANVTMEINSYPPIYTMSAQSDNIMRYTLWKFF